MLPIVSPDFTMYFSFGLGIDPAGGCPGLPPAPGGTAPVVVVVAFGSTGIVANAVAGVDPGMVTFGTVDEVAPPFAVVVLPDFVVVFVFDDVPRPQPERTKMATALEAANVAARATGLCIATDYGERGARFGQESRRSPKVLVSV
jgi:hypothetical protein